MKRNTPIVTRQARKGYRPLRGTVVTSHPLGQITPSKVHVLQVSKDDARG